MRSKLLQAKYIIVLFLFFSFSASFAGERGFYDDAKRGWFWFEKPKVKKKRKEEKKKVIEPAILSPEHLNNMTAEQFKKLYEDVRGIAVMNPTEQNIGAFIYLTDYMRRKSLDFAYAYQNYVLQHPEYDMNRVSGTTSWSWREASLEKEKRMLDYIKNNINKIGLYFFASAGCRFCSEQAKIVRFLLADYNIAVKTVTNNFCTKEFPSCSVNPVMFEKFKVKTTPSIVLVYKGSNGIKFASIASGLVTEESLIRRIYLYLRYFETGKWEINSLIPDRELRKSPELPQMVLREGR